MKYSKNQLKAIKHVDGPMIVLAGPGSGKTALITGRVRYLLEEVKINPENILVITFTKAAAMEMRDRFIKLMGESRGVRFATFHSVFFMIIRLSYGYGVEQIITEDLARGFIREKIREIGLEESDEKDFIKNIIAEISRVKSERVDINRYYSLNCPEKAFRDIFKSYINFMKKKGLIDFDDMMLICEKLFNEHPKVLKAWQNKYKYILIDEFQDVSKLQFNLVRKMAEPLNNIFIVGDDDQSIYKFRGASPEIMLGFEKIYPNCKKVVLDENYRSTEEILKFADRIIKKNKKRFEKNIKAKKGEGGKTPVIREFSDRKEEDIAIVQDILKSHKNGLPLSEIAVLYRTNISGRPLISKLIEYNVPFVMKEMLPNIYDHFISKNILDYLEIASGNRNIDSFLHIMNRPNRFISRDSLKSATILDKNKKERVSFIRWRDFYKGKTWMIERLNILRMHLDKMSELAPFGAIHYLRNVVGYDGYLQEYAKERGIDEEELFDILEEVTENSKPFHTLEEFKKNIKEVTEKQREQIEKNKSKTEDAVNISTMHGAKGLEFEKVYIPEVIEGMLPYKKAIRQSDIEEERRLFYVALTRAKKELVLTFPRVLYGKDKAVSPFIREFL